MRKMFVLAAILVVVSTAAAQAVTFTENFSGNLADNWSPFGSVLSSPTRNPALLQIGADPDDANNPVGKIPASYWTVEGANYYGQMRHNLGEAAGNGYTWTTRMWLPAASLSSNIRTYFQAIAYDGSMNATQIIGIGVDNAAAPNDQTKWQARVLYGGGAGSRAGGWYNTSISRVGGWHTLSFTLGAGTVDFYVDDALALSTTRNSFDPSYVAVGYAGQSVNGPMYYDNVSVAAVPEPSSMLALASGLIGMAGFVTRRRK